VGERGSDAVAEAMAEGARVERGSAGAVAGAASPFGVSSLMRVAGGSAESS
jgi:hypothetical protein